MANNLSLSNVINVTLVPSIAGLSNFNTANLLLLTNDAPITDWSDREYKVYYSASLVAEDFGVDSLTYKMALGVFSQAPNILSNSGALIIALKQEDTIVQNFNRLKQKVLFCGFMTTLNELDELTNYEEFAGIEAQTGSDNLATIKALVDPSLTITANGENITVNFDFSDANDMNDIANIIKETIQTTSEDDNWDFEFADNDNKAGLYYVNSNIESFTINNTDLTEALKLDSDSDPETFEYKNVTGIANVVNAENNKINFVVINDSSNLGNCQEVTNQGLKKTRCLFYGGTFNEAKVMMASYASKAMSTIFEASLTTQTMHLKPLAGVSPDPIIDETLLNDLKNVGVDSYVSIEGVACVFSTGKNGFFDEVFNELWFVNAIQTAGFNYLRQTNTKIPQTENGMTGLKNAYAQVCVRGINNGFLAAGSWTSPDTFGNPDLFKRNIETSGYYIYSQPVAQQNKEDREERKAPLVQIAIKTAGAIHSTNVMIYVNL